MRTLARTEVGAVGDAAKTFSDLAKLIGSANSMWDLRNLNIADLKAGFANADQMFKDHEARIVALEAKAK